MNPTNDEQPTIRTGDWITHDVTETFKLGENTGAALRGGEILLLEGPLGAGKTILAKGLASALCLDPEDVSSPTFTLVNRYTGRLTLYHLDLYRLPSGPAAAAAVDLDELLAEEQSVILIEWADRLGAYSLPAPYWRIRLMGDGDDPRQISVARVDA